MIGTRIGNYEITAKLGEGGMGEVWRATDPRLKREVAIKVLPQGFADDKDRLARFEREAQLLAQLHHPNIASIFGVEESSGVRALVMELVEGPTLAERLEAGSLPLTEVLSIARQIAEALEEAHEKGIIHRDLKPQNVKAAIDGKTKVLDFGLAKAMDPTGGVTGSASQLAQSPTLTLGATVQGVILGTAAYMAPEQAAGGVADRRADVWSFGVVLYEMLSGRRLFEGETVSHVLAGVLREEPDFSMLPADTPPRILRLVRRCLRKKPRERLQAIGDARVVIDEVLAGVEDAPVASVPAALGAPSRPLWQIALGALAAVALGALAATVLAGRRGGVTSAPRTLSELSLPAGNPIALNGDPALSPDGTRLALLLADETTRTRTIWIRNLATGDLRQVPGTENANVPFWSPDGRSLGFRTSRDNQLKRVDLDGGRPVRLAKADYSCGGSWGRDYIVFCSSWNEPLQRIAPSGGAAEPLTQLEKDEFNYMPSFLPDGKQFLFGKAKRGGEDALFVGSVDGAAPRKLIVTSSKGLYADRRLYYMRGETLLSRPFDATTARLGEGEPEIVAEGLGTRVGGTFTVSGGLLVYRPKIGLAGSRIAIYDRAGKQIDRIDSDTFLDDLVLSADGRTAAVMKVGAEQDDGDSGVDVWTLDLARKVFNRATYGESDDDPVFSPDGLSVAFAHEGDLYRRPANGSGEPQLVIEKKGDIVTQDWTSEGWIVYSDLDGDNEDLYAIRAEGGEPRRLTSTPYREGLAKVSADGRWLAYASNESGEPQVYLTSWPGFEGKWRVSTVSAAMPRWGRGGRELYFLTQDSQLMRAAISGTGNEPQIGLAEELFPVDYVGSYFARTARWAASNDGERFYVLEAIPGEATERQSLMLVTNPAGGRGSRQ